MRYSSGGAFRRALEERLRKQSFQSGIPLARMRKMIAFDRFLARLFHDQPEEWVVKGRLALQLRLGERARTTKDVDLLLLVQLQEIYPRLRKAGAYDLADWFHFEVANVSQPAAEEFGGSRYHLQSFLMDVFLRVFTLTLALAICLLSLLSICRRQTCWNLPVFCQQLFPVTPLRSKLRKNFTHTREPFNRGKAAE